MNESENDETERDYKLATYTVGEGATELEDGQYTAVIDSVEPVVQDPNQQRLYDKDQLVITWKLTDVEREDGSDITRRQYVNDVAALTPRAGLYKVFSAVLNNGDPLEKGVNYDTSQLIGKPAVIFWGTYVGADGTNKQKVLTVSPPKSAKSGSGTIRRKVSDEDSSQIDVDEALSKL